MSIGRFRFWEKPRNYKNSNPKSPKNILGGFGFGKAVFGRSTKKKKSVIDIDKNCGKKYIQHFVHKLKKTYYLKICKQLQYP